MENFKTFGSCHASLILPLSPSTIAALPNGESKGWKVPTTTKAPPSPPLPSPFPRSAARLPPVIKKREESREFTEMKFDEAQTNSIILRYPIRTCYSPLSLCETCSRNDRMSILERRSKSRWPRPKAAPPPPLYASQTAILIQRRLLPPPAYSAGRWGEKKRESEAESASARDQTTDQNDAKVEASPLFSSPGRAPSLLCKVLFALSFFSALFSQSAKEEAGERKE